MTIFEKLLLQIGEYKKEYQFCLRKFKFDYAIIEKKIAIEIEGIFSEGIFGENVNSRHRSFTGFIHDVEKYNLAVLNGWRVIRFSTLEINQAPDICVALVDMIANNIESEKILKQYEDLIKRIAPIKKKKPTIRKIKKHGR